jgi:hypothetical protein
MESVIVTEVTAAITVFEFSQAHFVGGIGIGLAVWILTVLASKAVTAIKTIVS